MKGRRARARAVLSGAVLGMVLVTLVLVPLLAQPAERQVVDDAAAPADRARVLLERHDCWTREAPADMQGQVPGRVVVQLADGRVVLGGDRLVRRSLEQLFEGAEYGLSVKGFCR